MSELILLLTFLGSDAGLQGNYLTATDNIRRGILEYPHIKAEMQGFTDNCQAMLKRETGMTPEDFVYAAYVYPIVTKTVTTKLFHDLKIEVGKDSFIFPEFEWKVDGSETVHGGLVFSKAF